MESLEWEPTPLRTKPNAGKSPAATVFSCMLMRLYRALAVVLALALQGSPQLVGGLRSALFDTPGVLSGWVAMGRPATGLMAS